MNFLRSADQPSLLWFGVHLMEAGADLVLAQDLLGHKNIANTRIYARLTSARRDQFHRAALDTRRIVGV